MSTIDKKARVLCVEDDPQMRTFLLAQLKARGFQAQAVSDGARAIDLAAIFQPHLILLDLSLPTLDGLAFLRRFARVEQSARHRTFQPATRNW